LGDGVYVSKESRPQPTMEPKVFSPTPAAEAVSQGKMTLEAAKNIAYKPIFHGFFMDNNPSVIFRLFCFLNNQICNLFS